MRFTAIAAFFFFFNGILFAQDELLAKQQELEALRVQEKTLQAEIEDLQLNKSITQLKEAGSPTAENVEIIEHSGMILGFDCRYKMAAWTFHLLSPDILDGNVTRTNDFRIDEKASCGSAVEADYFLKTETSDGAFEYDGFGFDRGHLTPSADFRWSEKGLSETYFYSNMTPQRPEFNRESWAELEALLRTITVQENKNLYILTGPILHDSLPVIERSVNELRIPEWHYKIVADLSSDTPRGMAFLMPNQKCEDRLSEYVVSIDSIEQLTGLDFFTGLNDELEQAIEATATFADWKAQEITTDVEPLNALALPKGHFNTKQAASKDGRKVSIVGKVVSTKFIPKSQSTFLNLDQSFPNQIFSVMIWKDGRRNFSYLPEKELDGKYIVVTGVVTLDRNGSPSITVEREEQIQLWEGSVP